MTNRTPQFRLRQMIVADDFWSRAIGALTAGAAVLVAALWVAICAAAPELIWQGLRIAASHLTGADLAEALLLGMILAFFVEPLMRRVHVLLRRGQLRAESEPGHPLFAASLGLGFALVAVGVHDSLASLVNKSDDGITGAIRLTTAWAIVPGAVTLAWVAARRRWLAWLIGIFAALSGCIVGALFSWSASGIFDTVVPSVAILFFGYSRATKSATQMVLIRCAPVVAATGAIWIVLAVTVDLLLRLWFPDAWQIYRPGSMWIDLRFYIGWALGLLLAPALLRAQQFGHLDFQRGFDRRLHRSADEVRIALQQDFDIDDLALTLNLGHGMQPRQRVGDVEHHPHTMTAWPSNDFAEVSRHYQNANCRGAEAEIC
jgi:hypothetical protein